MTGIWETEANTKLLLDAEIEPDADRDGYGDLTQDVCPGFSDDHQLCRVGDQEAPTIRFLSAAWQGFLSSGAIPVRVKSSETGHASAEGWLRIKGRDGRVYRLRGVRKRVVADSQRTLRLPARKRTLRAARSAMRFDKKMLVTVRVGVVDAAGNERQKTAHVRPR